MKNILINKIVGLCAIAFLISTLGFCQTSIPIIVTNTSTLVAQIHSGQSAIIELRGEYNVYLNDAKTSHMNVVTDVFPGWGPTIRVILLDPDNGNAEIEDFDFNSRRDAEQCVTISKPTISNIDIYIRIFLIDPKFYQGREYYRLHSTEQFKNRFGEITGPNPENPLRAYVKIQ